ncbi:hypothetical protein DEU56DRAFT_755559 [Suillus clintonianus]|uniref:uncharacterized protein n=1 Tax=Suillus clintonianus TaxID=1904413 RepID=UPI001B85D7D0|nr:uncharacterized protein DEU56DRAFT_755559 [Suillus clintonianus]KAG2139242.1 hypothetical protein DEU56DRAFT_755559 [Suillus clintonianus]
MYTMPHDIGKTSEMLKGNGQTSVASIHRVSQIPFSVKPFVTAHNSAKRKTGENAAYDSHRSRPPDVDLRHDRSTHKLACREVERSSGTVKFIRMLALNPLLMGYLKIATIFDCGLLDNPRIGFDVPFVARVDIAIEPSDILDFIGLYLDDKTIGEKLQGMVQVNATTPCHPSLLALTPNRLDIWREERAKYNADGYAKDPVGLIDFVDNTTYAKDSCQNAVTAGLHIPTGVLDWAKKREPFVRVSAVTGTQFKQPMSAAACVE